MCAACRQDAVIDMRGDFTLPGESGYEKLTLEIEEKWGADMIRDSDGTKLSDELLNAGYGRTFPGTVHFSP